jgi:uncharacterized membrane protein YkvA (DUF1232 family)
MISPRNDDVYQTLRLRIASWLKTHGEHFRHAQLLLLAPDLFHLLCKLALDERIPIAEKARLAAAIAYFVSPLDFMPEAVLGIPGYVDDIALAAYTLNRLVNAGHGAIAQEHWAGEGEILSLIQQILSSASDMIGAGVWEKLRSRFDKLSR